MSDREILPGKPARRATAIRDWTYTGPVGGRKVGVVLVRLELLADIEMMSGRIEMDGARRLVFLIDRVRRAERRLVNEVDEAKRDAAVAQFRSSLARDLRKMALRYSGSNRTDCIVALLSRLFPH